MSRRTRRSAASNISGSRHRHRPARRRRVVAHLSRPFDVAKFGVIYAGAQKNIGPAGLTVVIVRDDLTGRAQRMPSVLDYGVGQGRLDVQHTGDVRDLLAGLTFSGCSRKAASRQSSARTSRRQALYAAIDGTGFYRNPVRPADRSRA
jgi:phosphoserine aminotransferase